MAVLRSSSSSFLLTRGSFLDSLDNAFDLSGGCVGLKVVAKGNRAEQLCVYVGSISEQSPSSPLFISECTFKQVCKKNGEAIPQKLSKEVGGYN